MCTRGKRNNHSPSKTWFLEVCGTGGSWIFKSDDASNSHLQSLNKVTSKKVIKKGLLEHMVSTGEPLIMVFIVPCRADNHPMSRPFASWKIHVYFLSAKEHSRLLKAIRSFKRETLKAKNFPRKHCSRWRAAGLGQRGAHLQHSWTLSRWVVSLLAANY